MMAGDPAGPRQAQRLRFSELSLSALDCLRPSKTQIVLITLPKYDCL